MTVNQDSLTDAGFEAALRELGATFAAELPGKITEIATALRAACKVKPDAATLQLLHRRLHMLHGSARTFGFNPLADVARKLEHALVPFRDAPARFDHETGMRLLALLDELSAASELPQDIAFAGAPRTAPPGIASRAVYVLDGDPKTAATLVAQLNGFAYAARSFETIKALAAAVIAESPGAIVADIDALEDRFGADTIAELRQGTPTIPLIFTSTRGDIGARLRAARIGGEGYFPKPIGIGQLIDRLDALVYRATSEPYRVLVVEDAPTQAEYFAAVLRQAGIRSSIVSNPELLLEALNDFNPELILMDMYLPGCTGDELAAVIRQTDAFLSVPIVFLSVERDFDRQLSALVRGGDEFLTKPILPAQLVSVVKTRVERYRQLRTLMLHDSLTGLVNHSRLQQQLEIETGRALRQGRPMVLAMIDIDHFKLVNDRFGHPVGDRVLKNLSRFLRQRLRASDVVGRYGGEEFAVILPDTALQVAFEVMDGLRGDFAAIAHETDAENVNVTFSVGLAAVPRYASARDLLVAADKALYQAKREGRNRVIVNSD
jgi:diguanylate cyclase (GGDEF)-like protein